MSGNFQVDMVLLVVLLSGVLGILFAIRLVRNASKDLEDRKVKEVPEGQHNCIAWVHEYSQPIYLMATWWEKHPPKPEGFTLADARGISSVRSHFAALKLSLYQIDIPYPHGRSVRYRIKKE